MTDKNIHQRLAAVMGEVTYIQKEQKKGMNYTIVSHDVVTAKVRPALLKHGIVYYPTRCEHTHNGNRAECSMTVRFANIDKPEDCIDVQTFGYGVDPQDKGPGKAMSYAVKYALLKALGLGTGDDADHDSIPHTREDPHTPPFDANAATARIISAIERRDGPDDLAQLYRDEKATIDMLGDDDAGRVMAAFKAFDLPVTRLMTVKQMTAFMDEMQRHWIGQGVRLTDPEALKYEQEFA